MKLKTIKKEVEVFDLGKFIESRVNAGETAKEILNNITDWALNCHGLTHKEANDKYGYGFCSKDCIKKEVEVEALVNELCTVYEKELLQKLPSNYKDGYIARDKGGTVCVYDFEPTKSVENGMWNNNVDSYYCDLPLTYLFPFITWEDEEPYKISELIGEEESDIK